MTIKLNNCPYCKSKALESKRIPGQELGGKHIAYYEVSCSQENDKNCFFNIQFSFEVKDDSFDLLENHIKKTLNEYWNRVGDDFDEPASLAVCFQCGSIPEDIDADFKCIYGKDLLMMDLSCSCKNEDHCPVSVYVDFEDAHEISTKKDFYFEYLLKNLWNDINQIK